MNTTLDRDVTPEGVSPRSYRFLASLLAERVDPSLGSDSFERLTNVDAAIENMPVARRQRHASRLIDHLLRQPRDARPAVTAASTEPTGTGVPDAALTPGVYEVAAGEIYVVKPNRDKTRLYAKRLVVITSDRLNDYDERIKIEFVYAPGAVLTLRPEDRMDVERAKALTIRYGRCIVCGHKLRRAQSVEKGIGPVCIKSFRRV